MRPNLERCDSSPLTQALTREPPELPGGTFSEFSGLGPPAKIAHHIGGTRSCSHRFEVVYSHQRLGLCDIQLAAAACFSRWRQLSWVSKYRSRQPSQELHRRRHLSIVHKKATVCRWFLHSIRIPSAGNWKSISRVSPIRIWLTAVNRWRVLSLILRWRKSQAAACLR